MIDERLIMLITRDETMRAFVMDFDGIGRVQVPEWYAPAILRGTLVPATIT